MRARTRDGSGWDAGADACVCEPARACAAPTPAPGPESTPNLELHPPTHSPHPRTHQPQLWPLTVAQIPMTLVHTAGLAPHAESPLHALVYGAYGACLPCEWRADHLPLLERGWVVALAHVLEGESLFMI